MLAAESRVSPPSPINVSFAFRACTDHSFLLQRNSDVAGRPFPGFSLASHIQVTGNNPNSWSWATSSSSLTPSNDVQMYLVLDHSGFGAECRYEEQPMATGGSVARHEMDTMHEGKVLYCRRIAPCLPHLLDRRASGSQYMLACWATWLPHR